MRKNALSEHQAPLGGPEGRNAGKAREFHEIIVIILYKTISYNTISNPKSYSFESDKVELNSEWQIVLRIICSRSLLQFLRGLPRLRSSRFCPVMASICV